MVECLTQTDPGMAAQTLHRVGLPTHTRSDPLSLRLISVHDVTFEDGLEGPTTNVTSLLPAFLHHGTARRNLAQQILIETLCG